MTVLIIDDVGRSRYVSREAFERIVKRREEIGSTVYVAQTERREPSFYDQLVAEGFIEKDR